MVRALAVLAAVLLMNTVALSAEVSADERTVVYLTFDDGPSLDDGTAAVLEVLARYNVQATFFVVGKRVVARPEMLRAVVNAGHAVASHTYDHQDLNALSPDQVRSQLTRTQDAIVSMGVPAPTCYRPPFGRTSDSVRSVANGLRLNEVLWSLDTEDWRRQGPGLTVTKLLSMESGENVLMHDGWFHGDQTAAALETFLSVHAAEYDFRILPACRTGAGPTTTVPATTTTTTVPATTTTTTVPTTTTTTTVPTTTTTTTTTTVLTTITVPPDPRGPVTAEHCRRGPREGSVAPTGATQGATYRLYCAYFGRFPDAAGFAYWTDQLDAGLPVRALSELFLESSEFELTYGRLDDEDFLVLVYRNIFGRAADGGGEQYWGSLLASGSISRHELMLAFSGSREFRLMTRTG